MRSALENFVVTGIETTLPFLRGILNQPQVIKGEIHTRWIEQFLERPPLTGRVENGPVI
jgi:biotin carboxylase